jgi:hypothetical protein
MQLPTENTAAEVVKDKDSHPFFFIFAIIIFSIIFLRD